MSDDEFRLDCCDHLEEVKELLTQEQPSVLRPLLETRETRKYQKKISSTMTKLWDNNLYPNSKAKLEPCHFCETSENTKNSVVQLFDRVCTRFPQISALKTEKEVISYRQYREQAEQLITIKFPKLKGPFRESAIKESLIQDQILKIGEEKQTRKNR